MYHHTLTAEQLEFFEEQGYLVLENVIDDTTIDDIVAEYSELLNQIGAEKVAQSILPQGFNTLSFDEKYLQLLHTEDNFFDQIDITLPLANDFPPNATMHAGPAVFSLLTHPTLLDVVEAIIGPEIYCNPVQHVRIKPPRQALPELAGKNSYVGTTTWHQDHGALLDEANNTQVLTTWVAITDAPVEMGCLCCIPRSHKKGQMTDHCPGNGIAAENYIPGPLLNTRETVTLPIKKGGVILFHQLTEHAALNNKTDKIRWSFDLRWNPVGQPTGRPAFPGFIARSRSNPASELHNPVQWKQNWLDAKDRIVSGRFNDQIFNAERWVKNGELEICA